MFTLLLDLVAYARFRLRGLDHDRGALSAEMMVIIGVLVATAITVMAILAAKVIAKTNSIHL